MILLRICTNENKYFGDLAELVKKVVPCNSRGYLKPVLRLLTPFEEREANVFSCEP